MSDVILSRHVLAVRDLAASTRYFVEVLGFQADTIFADGWSFVSRGGFHVMLGECPDEVSATDTGNHSYFAFVLVDQVDGYYAQLQERGARFAHELADRPWGFREFCVRTPDGHRIVFGEDLRQR